MTKGTAQAHGSTPKFWAKKPARWQALFSYFHVISKELHDSH
jgi:hypothetical protein